MADTFQILCKHGHYVEFSVEYCYGRFYPEFIEQFKCEICGTGAAWYNFTPIGCGSSYINMSPFINKPERSLFSQEYDQWIKLVGTYHFPPVGQGNRTF